MTLTDPIGDMFARIRNGQLRQLKTIDVPSSNFRLKILEVLKQEGYISNYKILSELHFRKRDYEAASDILHQLIAIAPFKSEELLQPIEQIIQKIPRHPVIRTLYANVLFRAFKPIEGCQEVATLIKYHPNKKRDAIKLLKNQNDAFPQTPDILYLLSELMIESEQYTESLEHIQTIIDLSPNHCDKCLVLMQKIIQYYPKHGMALEIIGNIYFQQENYLQAFHYFNQCIEECENPKDLGFIEHIQKVQENSDEPSQNMAKLLIAKIQIKSNQSDSALKLIQELQHTEEGIEATFLKINILNDNHNSTQALPIIEDLLSQHPFHWNIHDITQRTFKCHTKHSIKSYKKQTESAETLLNLSSHYLSENTIEAAIKELQKITPQTTDYETAQRMLARCYFERSRFDLSDQIYSRIIAEPHLMVK